eukprot:scaffold16931_cov19-Tisochrysis_lutea.AAC.3
MQCISGDAVREWQWQCSGNAACGRGMRMVTGVPLGEVCVQREAFQARKVDAVQSAASLPHAVPQWHGQRRSLTCSGRLLCILKIG